MNLIRKASSVPLVGWLVGLVVLLALLAWRLFRQMRIVQQQLWVEQQLRNVKWKYQRQQKALDLKGSKKEVEVHRRTAIRVSKLVRRKREIAEKARDVESTAAIVNKVFGDP